MDELTAAASVEPTSIEIDADELTPAGDDVDMCNGMYNAEVAGPVPADADAGQASGWPKNGERMPLERCSFPSLMTTLALSDQSLSHPLHLPLQVPRRHSRRMAS
jgi:hypothetical protein